MSVRRIHRETALAAMRAVAGELGVEPTDVSGADYRSVRNRAVSDASLPSELAINVLFGGWHRACVAASTPWYPNVEDHVRGRLYGEPQHVERRHRVDGRASLAPGG